MNSTSLHQMFRVLESEAAPPLERAAPRIDLVRPHAARYHLLPVGAAPLLALNGLICSAVAVEVNPDMIAQAKPAADHEAAAKAYETQAAAGDLRAADHALTAVLYRAHRVTADAAKHCDALVAALTNAAYSSRTLTLQHRRLAAAR